MRYFLIALTFVLASEGRAQSTEDSIKAVINSMFDGMREADTIKLKNAFSSTIVFQTIGRNKEGYFSTRTEHAGEFITYMGQQKPGLLDERIRFGSILVDGPLASVWTPYSFYAGGKFSHCGVNSFQLVRFAEGWKIQYIIDTRRRDGCEEF